MISRVPLLIFNGTILLGCAVFIYPARSIVLTALLLLLPLIDRAWRPPALRLQTKYIVPFLVLAGLHGLLITMHPEVAYIAFSVLFLVALPEEWFFRAYFMPRLQSLYLTGLIRTQNAAWIANITTSLLFALTHISTQGIFGLTVFFPSLFFGWIYQKYNNLILVILMHSIFNLIFLVYIKNIL